MNYCRYCAFCIEGDVFFCTAKNKVLKNITNSVECEEYVESELGDVQTGKKYKPRKPAIKMEGQMNIFEFMGGKND